MRRYRSLRNLILVLLATLALLQLLLHWAITSTLLSLGAGNTSLERSTFNPFTGRLTLDQLSLYRDAARPLHLDRLMLDIDMSALFLGQWVVDSAQMSGLDLLLQQQPDGAWHLGPIALPRSGPSQQDEEATPLPSFLIRNLNFDSAKLQLRANGALLDLHLARLAVDNFGTLAGESGAQIELELELNGSPLTLSASGDPFTPDAGMEGTLQLAPLSLPPLLALTPQRGLLNSGALQSKIDWHWRLDGGIHRLTADGSVRLEKAVSHLLGLTTEDLLWEGSTRLGSGRSLTLDSDGKLTLTSTTLRTGDALAEWRRIHWAGKTRLHQGETLELDNSGELSLEGVRVEQQDNRIEVEKIAWRGEQRLESSKTTSLEVDGAIEAGTLILNRPEMRLSSNRVSYEGRLKGDFSDSENRLTGQVSVEVDGSSAKGPHPLRHATLELLSWNGRLEWLGEVPGLESDGEFHLLGGDINLADGQQAEFAQISHRGTVSWRQAEEQQLNSNGTLSLNSIDYKGAAPVTALTVQQLKLDGSKVEWPRRIDLGSIALHELNVEVERRPTTESEPSTTTEQGEQSSGAKAPTIHLTGLSGKGPQQLLFTDTTVTPLVQQRLLLDQLEIGEFDSAQPNRSTEIQLQGRLNQLANLKLTGKAQPLAEKINLDARLNLEAYELPPLQPYMLKLTGYGIESGQLDIDLQLNVEQNLLNSRAQITARQLFLRAEDEEKVKETDKQLNMPLPAVLALLRDDQNRIKLEVPIQGDLASPQFDIDDALTLAVNNSLRKASVSYLKYYFQPYSTVISLVQKAGEFIGRIRLDPIEFDPTSSELTPRMGDYLDKVGKLVLENEPLTLRLCPITVGRDAKDEAQGAPLAQARITQIKGYLSENFAINNKRMVSCQPRHETGEDRVPRVELALE